jgi:hypothetical protein
VPVPRLLALFILPPAAFGRLGGSSHPLDNYEWRTDPSIHGGSQTVIEPATTLDVADDGSVVPFRAGVIRFRDGAELRPVAPFFELWVRVLYGPTDEAVVRGNGPKAGDQQELPLTATLLDELGGSLGGVSYVVRVANRKAARRTGDDANAFEVALKVSGDDHARKPLLAYTPPRPGQQPLVTPDHPIPLGSFQVMRPIRRSQLDIDLDVLRARYTPARGCVYGPPTAVEAQGTTSPAFFEIVPPEHRILNPRASWLSYDGSYATYTNPEPWDTYDGADQDANVAWGVVDDTCDGTIEVSLIVHAQRFQASARLFVGPPDYAPDRRPFVSLADDLVDRDEEPVTRAALLTKDARDAARASVADLFARVFETASLLNLDAIRRRALRDNGGQFAGDAPNTKEPPYIDGRSLTPADVGYADDRVRAVVPDAPPGTFQFTPLVQLAHSPLAHDDELLAFLREQAGRARRMLRPAYGAFDEFAAGVTSTDPPAAGHRDPRIARDQAHDMRMPPYMRDETATALSLTRRQYLEVLALIDALDARHPAGIAALASDGAAPELAESGVRKRVRAVLAQARAQRGGGQR